MPRPIKIVEVVQTAYPDGEVRSRVHTEGEHHERGIVEGPSRSTRIRAWWKKARRQGVPIDTPIRARVVRDPTNWHPGDGRAPMVKGRRGYVSPRTSTRPVATLWKWVPASRTWVKAGTVTSEQARAWKAKRKLNPHLPYWVSRTAPVAAPNAARKR